MLASSTLWLAFQPNQQIVCAWNSTHNTGTICVAWGRIRAGIPNSLCFQKGRGIPKMFRQFKAGGGESCRSKSAECTKMVRAESGDDTEPQRTQVWLHTTTEMPPKLNIPIYSAITQHKCVNWEQQTKKINPLSQNWQPIRWSILITSSNRVPRKHPRDCRAQYTWSTLKEGTHTQAHSPFCPIRAAEVKVRDQRDQ